MSGLTTILKQKLAVPCRTTSSRWWLRTGDSIEVKAVAAAIEDPERIPLTDQLKLAKRRLVFRQPAGSSSVVVKAFPLQGLRRWAGRSGYAQLECQHLLEAESRGLRVPACLAYGERPYFGGLAWNAAVIEYVAGSTLRDQWLANPAGIDATAVLERLCPLAMKLYQTGCNHIDFGPHAILSAGELASEEDCLIDWQYASFYDAPNPYVFASQIGYFGWSTAINRSWLSPEVVRSWFDRLWESNQIPDYSHCKVIFEQTLVKRFSIQERLAAASTFAP